MKNLIAFLTFNLITFLAFAQTIEISEAARAKDNGTYNSYLFELPDVSDREAEDDWKNLMKDYDSKAKYTRREKIWTAENAKLPGLSDGTVTVYARIIEDSNPNKRTSVIVWFDLGDGYVNTESDTAKSDYAKQFLTEYAVTTSKHHAQAIVAEEEKQLQGLEKDLNKLERNNSGYHKDIDKAKESIAKNEKNIEVNELDQKNKAKEIAAQKTALVLAKANEKKFN